MSYLLAALVGGYLVVCGLLFVFQDRLLYHPVSEMAGDPGDAGLDFEQVRFQAADATGLFGWYVPAVDSRGVVLFCHGNAGNISHRIETLRLLNGLGLSVFVFDYRGYGKSRGRPTEEGTRLDAEAAWDWLTGQKGISPKRIVIWGRSLGAAVAARLAASRDPAALVVESAFTSVPDVGARHYPFLPVRLLSRYRYDTLAAVGHVDCPVLVVHSTDDEIVPYELGERIFRAAPEPKEMVAISGGHNGGFLVSTERYVNGVDAFLATHLNLGEKI